MTCHQNPGPGNVNLVKISNYDLQTASLQNQIFNIVVLLTCICLFSKPSANGCYRNIYFALIDLEMILYTKLK
jgi:hypothetical protein